MQAVGRLIRTENDKGIALLIDDRYCSSPYSTLFKDEWNDYEIITEVSELEEIVQKFWENK